MGLNRLRLFFSRYSFSFLADDNSGFRREERWIRISSGCDVVGQPLSRIGSWLINGNLRQLESQWEPRVDWRHKAPVVVVEGTPPRWFQQHPAPSPTGRPGRVALGTDTQCFSKSSPFRSSPIPWIPILYFQTNHLFFAFCKHVNIASFTISFSSSFFRWIHFRTTLNDSLFDGI